MPFPALIAFGLIAFFVYANRARFAVKFYHAKVRAGISHTTPTGVPLALTPNTT